MNKQALSTSTNGATKAGAMLTKREMAREVLAMAAWLVKLEQPKRKPAPSATSAWDGVFTWVLIPVFWGVSFSVLSNLVVHHPETLGG